MLGSNVYFKETQSRIPLARVVNYESKMVDRNIVREIKPFIFSNSLQNWSALDTKISLIKAQLALSELAPESYKVFHDSKYGWGEYSSNISEDIVSGEHATIFDQENITQIGNILNVIFERS